MDERSVPKPTAVNAFPNRILRAILGKSVKIKKKPLQAGAARFAAAKFHTPIGLLCSIRPQKKGSGTNSQMARRVLRTIGSCPLF
jgi:hypothetical protein